MLSRRQRRLCWRLSVHNRAKQHSNDTKTRPHCTLRRRRCVAHSHAATIGPVAQLVQVCRWLPADSASALAGVQSGSASATRNVACCTGVHAWPARPGLLSSAGRSPLLPMEAVRAWSGVTALGLKGHVTSQPAHHDSTVISVPGSKPDPDPPRITRTALTEWATW